MRMFNETNDEYMTRLILETRADVRAASDEAREAKRLANKALLEAADARSLAQQANNRVNARSNELDWALSLGIVSFIYACVNSFCNASQQSQIDGLYAHQQHEPQRITISHMGLPNTTHQS